MQRIPAAEKTINLESPWQLKHVPQCARLCLGNIDRCLFLVDAGLHAVVADPVPGGRDHRVVNHDHGKGRNRLTLRFQLQKFADALLERATCKQHTKGASLEAGAVAVA